MNTDNPKGNTMNTNKNPTDRDVMQQAPSIDDAYEMGAKGAPPVEAERLAFEAWMSGHCWALCAKWDGNGYRSDAEQGGNIDPHAMRTRQLWAAWRDRAALAAPQRQPLSGIQKAAIGRKHFGNPIPQEWYAAARDLEAAHSITSKGPAA